MRRIGWVSDTRPPKCKADEEDRVTDSTADPAAHPAISLPAREIPVPTSVSAEAQAVLALGTLRASQRYPAPDDLEGWRAYVRANNLLMREALGEADDATVTFEEIEADGARIDVITPADIAPDDRRVYLDLHGGALILGGGDLSGIMAIDTARTVQARVWAVDYRMPPDHPYPTALDDCVAAYRRLLSERRPEEVIVGGISAGGNLAAAMILRARDEGLPLPAAAVLMTPEVDLTESGDSFCTNVGLDPMLRQSLMPANLLYAAGHDLRDPYVSPLYGDFNKGFPPTLLTTGTRDLFLSNTVLMHRALRRAGIAAELHVTEAAGHGGYLGQAPEDADIEREMRAFVDAHWPTG
jgi:acetyl esterase/lipase